MQNCSNCNAQITCGCQRRTATDGKSVCTNCITTYEAKLAELKALEVNNQTNNQTESNNV